MYQGCTPVTSAFFFTEGWGSQAGHEAALGAYGHVSAACSSDAVTSSLHDAVVQQLGMSSEPWHLSRNEARQQCSHWKLTMMSQAVFTALNKILGQQRLTVWMQANIT